MTCKCHWKCLCVCVYKDAVCTPINTKVYIPYILCYSIHWLRPVIQLFMHWGLQSTQTVYCERLWDSPYDTQTDTHTWPLVLSIKTSQCRPWYTGTDGYSKRDRKKKKKQNLMTHENNKPVHLSHGSMESPMFETSVSKRFAEHTYLMEKMTENNLGVFWTWRQRGPAIWALLVSFKVLVGHVLTTEQRWYKDQSLRATKPPYM